MPTPPKHPDYFDKVNFVIDSWTTGCEAPWYVYVQTMKPAALEALITLLTFGWDDVARGYFRPRGLQGRRTGKRKGKFSKLGKAFPELGEMLGEKLPGAEQVKGARWSDGLKTLWRIDTAIQQVLFYWLVADVTIDFAFNWTSLLYESYWCRKPDAGRFSYTKTDIDNRPGGTFFSMSYDHEDFERSPPAWLFARGVTGLNPARITATMRCSQLTTYPPPSSWELGVFNADTGAPYAISELSSQSPKPDQDIIVSGVVPPLTTVRVRARHDALYASWSDGVVIGEEIVDT